MVRQQSSRRKQRFLQFGLRQFLVLFAVISLLLGIVGPQIRKAFHEGRSQNELRRERKIQADLAMAIREGDVGLAQRSLDAGANPNLLLDSESDPLCFSVQNGQVDIIRLLLDHGAELYRNTDLLAAIECDQPLEVRLDMIRLLPLGPQPNRSVMDAAIRTGDAAIGDLLRESGLEYGPREMAAFNRFEELRRVVEENPSVIRDRFEPVYASRPGYGPTLLGIALYWGHSEIARYLIDRGAPLDRTEGLGSTLLHQAARGGDPELIRLLVARGLDVNARDDHKDTPLTDSVWCTRPEAIDALIEAGADVNVQGINEDTALHLAARSGRTEVVAKLLGAGADSSIVNGSDETPLDVVRKRRETLPVGAGGSTLRAKAALREFELQQKELRKIEKLLLEASR